MSDAGGDGAGSASGGVLGNLPRSRPGHRSDKRTEPEPRRAAPPPKGPSGSTAKRRAGAEEAARRPAAVRPVTPAPDVSTGGGPLGGAARVAGRAARAGLGVAGGVLKRLPRP